MKEECSKSFLKRYKYIHEIQTELLLINPSQPSYYSFSTSQYS